MTQSEWEALAWAGMKDVSGRWKRSKGGIWPGSVEKAAAVTHTSVCGECLHCSSKCDCGLNGQPLADHSQNNLMVQGLTQIPSRILQPVSKTLTWRQPTECNQSKSLKATKGFPHELRALCWPSCTDTSHYPIRLLAYAVQTHALAFGRGCCKKEFPSFALPKRNSQLNN